MNDQFTPKPRKLRDHVRDSIQLKKYSDSTEKTFVPWIRNYILFHNEHLFSAEEIEAIITHLPKDKSGLLLPRTWQGTSKQWIEIKLDYIHGIYKNNYSHLLKKLITFFILQPQLFINFCHHKVKSNLLSRILISF